MEDSRLKRLTKIALALPETTRKICGSHAAFLVRNKNFAYFLDNHHGDGIVAIHMQGFPGDNKALVAAQPKAILFACLCRAERLGGASARHRKSRLGRGARPDDLQLSANSAEETRTACRKARLTRRTAHTTSQGAARRGEQGDLSGDSRRGTGPTPLRLGSRAGRAGRFGRAQGV
jgi:hypothetical protein